MIYRGITVGDYFAVGPGMLNKRPVATGQGLGALLEQQRRQCDSMDRIAAAMEVMVSTSMTVALVYPWKNDPSVVRAVVLRNEHDRQRIRLSLSEFASSNRAMSVEEWLRKDGFVVLNSESLFVDGNGIGMFTPRAAAAHRELIPPAELDASRLLRLQRDVEAEEAEAHERERRQALPRWSARGTAGHDTAHRISAVVPAPSRVPHITDQVSVNAGERAPIAARKTVLVVDDEPTNIELIRMITEEADLPIDLAIARNGWEAIEQTKAVAPVLILMDLKMPVLDGWEATRRLKADPATAAVPVIALTAQAMAGDRDRALAAGCDGYLTKPVELGALLALLRGRLL